MRTRQRSNDVWIWAAALALVGSGCAATREVGDNAPTRLSVASAVNSGASIASAGTSVVVAWAATTAGETNIYAATSEDAGRTFGDPVRVNDVAGDARVSAEQPPRASIGDSITVVWSSRLTGQSRLRMARSADGGRTFSPAVTAHEERLGGARGWSSVVTDGGNGTHVVWLDGRNATHTHGQSAGTSPPRMRQDIFHALWRPASPPVETRVAVDVCFCCKTSVAVGPDDAVYVAWRHIYPTNLRDMAVARSTDGGRTFGDPVRVSADGWQIDGCPEDGPAIGVGANGIVHIAWPTVVQDGPQRKAVFYSYSADAGRTFAPRLRLDDEAARHAAHPQLSISGSDVAIAWDETTADGHRIQVRDVRSSTQPTWTPDIQPARTVGTVDTLASPAIAPLPDGWAVAWATGSGASEIEVRRIPRGVN
jgi:hypothetical protein